MSTQCEPWPLAQSCLPAEWSLDPVDWTPEQRAAVEVSSGLLRRFTAGQYGLCSVKLRPCRKPCARRYAGMLPALAGLGAWAQPVLYEGQLYNLSCSCSGTTCGCSALAELPLPGPAYDVLQVKLDGEVLPNTAYRLDSRQMLVRLDGEAWPDCQELDKPDTELGTFSVTYRRGNAVDAAGRLANTLLATELYKACHEPKKCALPARVTSVVREGITYDLLDDLSVFERGRTGIPRVDMWLAAVNPFSARASMAVYSPDLVTSRETTWPVDQLPVGPNEPSPIYYRHVQSTPAAVWTIVHGLGFYPGGVTIEDTDSVEINGEVSYPDINTVRVDFNDPTAGVAYLS